jgi:L-amino acid N-acyltransferase YncA
VSVTVAPMTAEHWDVVRAIFQEGIDGGTATFETAVPEWSAWDAVHRRECRFVALDDGRVVGWAALSPVSSRSAYAGVAEVSVYVARAAQGRGIGRSLLDALVAAAEAAGIWTLQAVVFPENGTSLELHRGAGFRVVGRRERIARLRGVWHDTVLLERRSGVVGDA